MNIGTLALLLHVIWIDQVWCDFFFFCQSLSVVNKNFALVENCSSKTALLHVNQGLLLLFTSFISWSTLLSRDQV